MKGSARTIPGFIESLINSGKIAPSPELITIPVNFTNTNLEGDLHGLIMFPTEVIIEHFEMYVENVYSGFISTISATAHLDVPSGDFTYLPKFNSEQSSLKDYFQNKKINGITFDIKATGFNDPNIEVNLQISYYKFIN